MIRRVGKPPLADQRYTLRPGAYAILPRGNSVLLTIQDDGGPEFQLPGGGIDPGESNTTALHREVFEETGWKIASPRKVGAFRRFVFVPEYDLWAEKICHVYLAFPTRQIGPPTEPDHLPIWTDFEFAAKAVVNEGDRLFLQQVLL
jgi:8-oxo-dGTP diphosphatase